MRMTMMTRWPSFVTTIETSATPEAAPPEMLHVAHPILATWQHFHSTSPDSRTGWQMEAFHGIWWKALAEPDSRHGNIL